MKGVMSYMDAEYFEREYSQIVREWKCASTDDEKWSLRARMAKLERTAGTVLGTDYMDELHTKYVSQIPLIE